MALTNEQRIAKGHGWVTIGHSADGKNRVDMLREKIDIWHPKKDRILRIVTVDKKETDEEEAN